MSGKPLKRITAQVEHYTKDGKRIPVTSSFREAVKEIGSEAGYNKMLIEAARRLRDQ